MPDIPYGGIIPQPNARGLERVKILYRERTGRDPSDDEAYDILYAAMRWVWAIHRPQD